MVIYNEIGTQIFDITIDARTKLKQNLTGEDRVNLVFVTDVYKDFAIGDYILWRGIKYTLLNEPSVKKVKVGEYSYNVDFLAPKFQFEKALMLLDSKTEYFLFGEINEHAEHIISNINRVLGTLYVLGSYPTTEALNLEFKNANCLDALNDVAKLFNKEYTINGLTIDFVDHVGNPDTGLNFQYKQGLKGIERKKLKDNELTTRLYPLGSERNIKGDYGFKRLRVDPIERNVDLFGIFEKVKIFDEVYPRRLGTVGGIGATIFEFTDSGMNFDLNTQGVLMGDEKAKITFNTGDLTGYEFEIFSYTDAINKFEILPYTDNNGLTLPNDTLKPQIGDKYVIYNINMPDAYVLEAENELRQKAEEYLNFASLPTVEFVVNPNIDYLSENNITLSLGDEITIVDNDLNVSILARIKELTQSIIEPYQYTIKVGNKTKEGFVRQITNRTANIESNVSSQVEELNKTINHLKNKTTETTTETVYTPLEVGSSLLLPETKGQNFIASRLKVLPNYSDDVNRILIEEANYIHFTIEDTPREWLIPEVLRQITDINSKYYLYAKCPKVGGTGEFVVSKEYFRTENGSDYYFFLLGVLSEVTNGSRIFNSPLIGGGTSSVNNVTQVFEDASDTPEIIADKYEGLSDVNRFTDALKAKLDNINVSGQETHILFGEPRIYKAQDNTGAGLEKNDYIIIRFTNGEMLELLYDGVGDQALISSYRVISKTKLKLFA